MAVTATLSSVVFETDPSTRILVKWSNGSEWEFNGKQELKGAAGAIDDDVDLARKMLLVRWIRANPTLNNPSLVEGKTITFDVTATPMIQITG